jgi:hypothetical protein
MATAAPHGLFARKPTEMLLEETRADPEHGLKRAVGVLDLTALGIGAVIGSRGAPTPTATRRSASSSRGSSAGT